MQRERRRGGGRASAGNGRLRGPRERLRDGGAAHVSDVDLLAVVLRHGVRGAPAAALASRLLDRFGSLQRLDSAGDAELLSAPGIGPANLAALRAAVEIGRRAVSRPLERGARIRSPTDVHEHLGPAVRALRQEVFFTLLLDSRHRLVKTVEVSRGSLNQSLVHPREVFAPALRESAAAILVVHNHPSGDPAPSRDDHDVTRRLTRAGEVLGVPLLDHVIIAADGFTSFADRGWLPLQGAAHEGR